MQSYKNSKWANQILAQRREDGLWDFGEKAKDDVYFPLSDWWNKETRAADAAYGIHKLVSSPCYCGHDCSRCITYIATKKNDNILRVKSQQFYKETFGLELSIEKFNCEGGRSEKVFELCKCCPFVSCCQEHNVESCNKCSEYPCSKISDYQSKYVNKCNQIGK